MQRQIQQKIEAFERFVNLNAIGLGILQILALEQSQSVWKHFPRWFRTLPEHGHPTEQIVRITLQHQLPMIFARSRPTLLLSQLLADKIECPTPLDPLDSALDATIQMASITFHCPVKLHTYQ